MSKYVVFKTEDWQRVSNALRLEVPGDIVDDINSRIITDAEVIRHQDITSASIFYHYASTVESFAEIGLHLFNMSDEQARELRRIADYFAQAADAARHHPAKRLPTI